MIKFLKQVFKIISRRDRKILILIFFMILISSGLDLIGVSAIIPVVSLLSSPDSYSAIQENVILRALSVIFNTIDTTKLSIIAMLFIVVIYVIKTGYAFMMTYVNIRFTMNFNKRLRARLMKIYLSMPYEFHHENNSSTLIRKSTYDVDIFCSAVSGFLGFLVKLATSITIIIFLFISSWLTTLIISSFLGSFALFTVLILKKKNRRLGKNIQELNSFNYQYLSQSFNGIKESKISNTENYFINQYTKNIGLINHYTIRKTMYSSIPGHSLELVGMLGLVSSLLLITLIGGEENYQIISTFAVFAYAVIKLLPCVTDITSYVNSFAFYSSSVDTIYHDLLEVEKFEEQIEKQIKFEPIQFNNEIAISNVSFAYKDEPDKKILTDISFMIKKNTSVAISGSSGAGKTTMIDLILGLLKPTNGSITCDGIDINENVRGWRNNLSYVPQNIYLTDDTIRNNIAFGIDRKSINDRDIWDALDKAQLREFVEKSSKGLDTIIGERGIRLSGGQRQRIGIARAFYRNSNIIVLDEATSALDYETEKNILDHVNEYSKDHTLIIITHRLNTIESCDYIYRIENGLINCIKNKTF